MLDTPLAESGIVGTAIGLAMRGYRPVCEIQFDGFVYPAFDQITSQLAKLTNRHEGALSMPVVIRIPYGGHIGAVEHHQESPEAYFAHTAGLRVVSPSTPHDAYWMIQDAIRVQRPGHLHGAEEPVLAEGRCRLRAARRGAARDAGRPARHRGHACSATARWCLCFCRPPTSPRMRERALRCSTCARSRPIDYAPILESVRKTGRLVIAQEAPGSVSVGSEIAATVAERAFYSLESPVLRVSGFDTPFPPAKLETIYLPDADRVLEAVDRALAY